jgi:CheY-like chemotaxis protein
LVEGWHPIVDVATAARTAREGPAAWSAAPEGALALLYPAPGTVDASWIREVARLTTGLRDQIRFAGLLDSDALVLISSSGQSALAGSLRDARSPSATWHAGVVAHVAGMTWDATLTAAREALDVARRAVDRNVHEWVHEDSSIPPDVIIIEDDAALADMLEYALQMAGHTFQRFDDGRVALEALLAMRTGSHHPVILLDVDLPGLDGHSIHERLRVDRPGAFVVVFVSAHGGEGEQLRALNAGAWDYLTKPLSLRVLLAKLPVWLARSSATA